MRRRVNEKCPFGLRKGKIGDFYCRRNCDAYEGGSALFVQCGASETPTFESSVKVGDWVFFDRKFRKVADIRWDGKYRYVCRFENGKTYWPLYG